MTRRRRPATAALAAAVAVVTLAACGGGDDRAATGSDTAAPADSDTGTDNTADAGADTDSGTMPAGTTASAAGGLTGFAYGTGACPPDDGVDEPVRRFDVAPRLCIDPAATYTATFVTSEGTITVALDAAARPGTVNNFVTLARYGYYDDTPIFRAEPTSGLFQGGGQDNLSSPGYTIADEGTGFTYPPGTLAMARTSQANSAGAQWFFTTDEKAEYLAQYGTFVVFGHVVEGLDVAQAITAAGDASGVPTRPITLETVTIAEATTT